jgi:hypothetical protein
MTSKRHFVDEKKKKRNAEKIKKRTAQKKAASRPQAVPSDDGRAPQQFTHSLFDRLKAWTELFAKRGDVEFEQLELAKESKWPSEYPKKGLAADATAFAKRAKRFFFTYQYSGMNGALSDATGALSLSLEGLREPAILQLDGEEVSPESMYILDVDTQGTGLAAWYVAPDGQSPLVVWDLESQQRFASLEEYLTEGAKRAFSSNPPWQQRKGVPLLAKASAPKSTALPEIKEALVSGGASAAMAEDLIKWLGPEVRLLLRSGGSAAVKKSAGGWKVSQRRDLSAIRVPHRTDPEDYYYDPERAEAKLGEAKSVNDQPLRELFAAKPRTALTLAGERQRYAVLASNVSAGLSFTDDFFNPLIALWVGRQGWDFAFDLLLPTTQQPFITGIEAPAGVRQPDLRAWRAVRRYLHRATPGDFEKARLRVQPVFDSLVARVHAEDEFSYEGRNSHVVACWIAFAFDRHPAWVAKLLTAFVEDRGTEAARGLEGGCLELLVSVNSDEPLSRKASQLPDGPWLRTVDGVYDLVETLGDRAVPLLRKFAPSSSEGPRSRKRLADALALAESLT